MCPIPGSATPTCLPEFPYMQNGFKSSTHVAFWGDENVLELDRVVVVQYCEGTKCH